MTSSERGAPAGSEAAGPSGALPRGLADAVRAGRVAPAYLLEGADADGVRAAGLELAALLLCPSAAQACCCASCTRARAGLHRDLHRVRRDKATVISVAALTPLLARAFARPVEGERQVFVVEPADAMDAEGVARYLKALEEPPPGSTFVLLTSRPERLPDPVRSRCQRVRVPPLTEAQVRAALRARGVGPEEAARAARLSSGSLARARRLLAAEIPARLDELVEAASGGGGVSRAVEAALVALKSCAAEAAPPEDVEPGAEAAGSREREGLRESLRDLLHAAAVEGREAAAGRPALGGRTLRPESGLDLVEAAGALGGATALNVTPVVVLTELVRALARCLEA